MQVSTASFTPVLLFIAVSLCHILHSCEGCWFLKSGGIFEPAWKYKHAHVEVKGQPQAHLPPWLRQGLLFATYSEITAPQAVGKFSVPASRKKCRDNRCGLSCSVCMGSGDLNLAAHIYIATALPMHHLPSPDSYF